MSKKKLLSFLFIFYYGLVLGQWSQVIDPILAKYPENAEIGVSIRNEKGHEIFSHNSDENFIPASLQKIVTNFAVLEILGGDYKFSTTLGYTGEILADGNLTGNLIIYGNGDPSLASERFQKRPQIEDLLSDIIGSVKKAGITCIDGEVICDASYYGTDGTVHSWSFNDIANYYACNTWSINLHENYYNLYFQLQNDRNKPPQILRHDPIIPGLHFTNELVSGPAGSGDQSYIFGAPYTYERFVRGSLPVGARIFKIKGAIPNSPQFLADLVASRLVTNGISNAGGSVEFNSNIDLNKKITTFTSPPLRELVKSANLESINLYCESFLMAIGQGSREKGIREAFTFLAKNGLDTTNIDIDDGSGLSFWNHISPADFSLLLNKLHQNYGDKLKAYFPEAGKTGTLSYMFKGKPSFGKLWAKTGSMQQVMNYAGFTRTASGEFLTFCIIANRHKISNRKIRRIHEELMNSIYLHG